MGVVARAHDLLVNTDMGDVEQPEWMVRVKEDYFKAGETMFTSRELPELLDEMDRMGVSAVLMTNLPDLSKRVLSFVDERPDRFTSDSAAATSSGRWRTSAARASCRPPGRAHRRRSEPKAGYPPSDTVYYRSTRSARARPAVVHEHRPPGLPIPVRSRTHPPRPGVRFLSSGSA
jgi:hypothetical protein